MKKCAFVVLALLGLVSAVVTATASGAGSELVVYSSIVSPAPGNLPSAGAQASGFRELGDEVTFNQPVAALSSVTVQMSSWTCQQGIFYNNDCLTSPGATFAWPITLHIYAAGPNGTAGPLLQSRTQTFSVPYRPSTSPLCANGGWHSSTGCVNGFLAPITFDLSGQRIPLPRTVIYGISYNTTSYGPNPIGTGASCLATEAGCPYDGLNIGFSSSVTTGSKPYPGTVVQNSPLGYEYCDGGAAGVGVMRVDSVTSACWTGYVPAVQFRISRLTKV